MLIKSTIEGIMKDVMLILHFLGLALGIGTSFGFMFLGMAAAKLEKDEQWKFAINTLALGRMGHIGIALLIISGGYLMTPHWQYLENSPFLMVKFALVLILIILIFMISRASKRARVENSALDLTKASMLGKFALIVGVCIVVFAVLHFG